MNMEKERIDRRYVCPKCSKRSMIKRWSLRMKGYILICKVCGAKRGPLPPARRRP